MLAQRERQERCVRKSQPKRKEEWGGRLIPNDRRYEKVAKEDNESLWGNRKLNQPGVRATQVTCCEPSNICWGGLECTNLLVTSDSQIGTRTLERVAPRRTCVV